jgi:hypothetical protein
MWAGKLTFTCGRGFHVPFTSDRAELQSTQVPSSGWLDKQTMVHSSKRTLPSNEKESATDKGIHLDEFQRH